MATIKFYDEAGATSRFDLIDGWIGADTMIGYGGNDTYIVDNTGDVEIETSDKSTNTVKLRVGSPISNNFKSSYLYGHRITVTVGQLNSKILSNLERNNSIILLEREVHID